MVFDSFFARTESQTHRTHRHTDTAVARTHTDTNQWFQVTHTKAQTHIHTHNPPTYTPHTHKLTHTFSEHVTKIKMTLSRGPGISVHPKLNIHFSIAWGWTMQNT